MTPGQRSQAGGTLRSLVSLIIKYGRRRENAGIYVINVCLLFTFLVQS